MLSPSAYLSSSSTQGHTRKSIPQSYWQNDYFHNNLASEATMFENNIQWSTNKAGHGPSSLDMADFQ